MNAQSVWPGHEYAYVSYVQKKTFPMQATKVKVLSLKRVKYYGKQREDTLATVEFDGGHTREVNVRNLYDFWDSYEDERQGHLDAQERRQQEAQKRAREAAELRLQEQRRKRTIANNLAYRLGIDPAAVETSYNGIVVGYNHLKFLEDNAEANG